MTLILRMMRSAGRRANPIVVRELRQAVRSRFVTGMLLVFLIVLLVVTGIYALSLQAARFEESLSAGEDVTMWLLGILFYVCMLFVPLYTGLRLVFERRGTQADLLFITTLSPGAIVRGKMFSAVMLTLLIFSACLPFLTFTYLLRGVDLSGLLLSLLLGFAGIIMMTQIALLISALPMSIVFRILISLGGIGFMGTVAGSLTAAAAGMQYSGITYNGEFWVGMGMIVAVILMEMGLLYVLTVAALSPPSANRTFPIRLYITGVWALLLIVIGGGCLYYHEWEAIIFAWLIPMIVLLLCAFVFGLCERQEWGPRIRRHIPSNPLGRVVAFLFYTGAPGAMLWSAIMVGLTLLIGFVAMALSNSYAFNGWEDMRYFVAAPLYVIAYGLTGLLLWLGVFRRWFGHRHIWVIILGIGFACILVPGILDLVRSTARHSRYNDISPLMILSPMALFIRSSSFDQLFIIPIVWATGTGALALGWAAHLFKQFRPLSQPAQAPPPIKTAGTVEAIVNEKVEDGSADS
jgi:hypothetical protein